jgi:hypothetical protein
MNHHPVFAVRHFVREVWAAATILRLAGRWPVAAALALAVAATLFGIRLRAATAEQRAVIAPLQALLDGLAKHDRTAVRDQLLPGGMATLLHNGQPLQLHFDAFVERLPGPGETRKLEERIFDPVVRIDDDIAVIWTPYDFLIDGKIDHCGTDLINLIRRDNRWLISGIADNSRHTCPAR